jgi:hypothetical protein
MLLDLVKLALPLLIALSAAQLVAAQDWADSSSEKADTYTLPIAVKPIEGMSYASAVAVGLPLGILVGNVEKGVENGAEPEAASSR